MKGSFVVTGKSAESLVEDRFIRVGPGMVVKECGGAYDLCMDYAENTVSVVGYVDEPFFKTLDLEVLEDNGGDTVRVACEAQDGKVTLGFAFDLYREFVQIG